MAEERYNGWTNRETWLVGLWLGNDEGLYSATNELVAEVCDDVTESEYEWQTLTEARTYHLETRLSNFVEELAEMTVPGCIEGANFVVDLVTTGLGRVNWSELAANYIEDEERERQDA